MTLEQYQRWCEFARRMARVCYARSRRPSAAWIAEQVEEFLARYEVCYPTVCNWDESTDVTWPVCDEWASWESDETPVFYFAEDYPDDDDWEVPEDWQERADERAELATAQWQAQYLGPVVCCIRAGLDMATKVTGGVFGFTVADLQAMFPEGIPDWIQRHFPTPLDAANPNDGIWL